MQQRIGQFFLIVALLLGLVGFAVPAPALAQEATPAPAPERALEEYCGDYLGLTNRIAGCVRQAVDTTAAKFFGEDMDGDGDPDSGFYPLVSKFIAGFLTLGIAIYGSMAAAGMLEKVGRDTLMFLTRLSLITFFVLQADLMHSYAVAGMDSLAEIAVNATPRSGVAEGVTEDLAQVQCLQRMVQASDAGNKYIIPPWAAMDCLIDTMFGIKMDRNIRVDGVGADANGMFNKQIEGEGLTRGMLYFFTSGMKGSVFGLILGVIGFIFMWGVVSMIIKSLFTYIAGYIGLVFMMIVAPLFIPLSLFRTTKDYFDKWAKLCISFALQPVLILLFISLAVTAIDLSLFSSNYSVMYRIAGEESRKQGFNLNTYLTTNEAIKSEAMNAFWLKGNTEQKMNFDDETVQNVRNSVTNVARGRCARSEINAAGKEECADNVPLRGFRDTLDWEKLAEIRKPEVQLSEGAENKAQQLSREVLAAVIFCGVVVFVMNRLMAAIPHVIVDLVGDFGQTPNLLQQSTGQWNNAAAQQSAQIQGGVNNAVREAMGSLAGRRSGT